MIENWNELTDEQKDKVREQSKKLGIEVPKELPESVEIFKNLHFIVVKNLIDKNMAKFLYEYVKVEANKLRLLEEEYGPECYDHNYVGIFNDVQAPGSFARYGDPTFDTLLELVRHKFEEAINIPLVSTYSYHRLYLTNSDLKRHKDRASCEISATLCLGHNISNVDKKVYPNYNWPMYVKMPDGKELPISLEPGDAIMYRGCEVEHWREPFMGLNHAQVFLHYNEKEGEFNNIFDGRKALGMPKLT